MPCDPLEENRLCVSTTGAAGYLWNQQCWITSHLTHPCVCVCERENGYCLCLTSSGHTTARNRHTHTAYEVCTRFYLCSQYYNWLLPSRREWVVSYVTVSSCLTDMAADSVPVTYSCLMTLCLWEHQLLYNSAGPISSIQQRNDTYATSAVFNS